MLSIALATNTQTTPGLTGGTSPSIDTTGATLLVVVSARFSDPTSGAVGSLSDSKGNTWVGLTEQNDNTSASRIWYVKNPVVGTGHTITYTGGNGTTTFLAGEAYFLAFKNVDLAQNVDQQNGSTHASATSAQPGSVTPSLNNELVVASIAHNATAGGAKSINGGFTIVAQDNQVGGVNNGGGVAYLVQTALAAANPTWSWSSSTATTTAIATFKQGFFGVDLIVPPYKAVQRASFY